MVAEAQQVLMPHNLQPVLPHSERCGRQQDAQVLPVSDGVV